MSPDALVGGGPGPPTMVDKCSEPMKGGDRLREPQEVFLGLGSPGLAFAGTQPWWG